MSLSNSHQSPYFYLAVLLFMLVVNGCSVSGGSEQPSPSTRIQQKPDESISIEGTNTLTSVDTFSGTVKKTPTLTAQSDTLPTLPLTIVTPVTGTKKATSGPKISSDVIIEYRRSGGFAGFDDHLTIAANGKAAITRRGKYHTFNLDPEVITDLQQQLDQIGFSRLAPKYLPDDTCCDHIEYGLTYQGHTVQAMDTTVPPNMQRILEILNQIVDANS